MTTESYAITSFFGERCGAITMNNARIKMPIYKECQNRIFKSMKEGSMGVPLLKNFEKTGIVDLGALSR